MIVYGIKNCDTVKKARKWLEAQGIDYEFHDYKTAGPQEVVLREAMAEHGWEVVLNRRGTTWRKLEESLKNNVVDDGAALNVMLEHSSTIKRPIVKAGNTVLVGFNEKEYQEKLMV